MPELQEFDPTIYFDITARNLLKNFGERALHYADEALKKMRALGDEDGLEMWLGIREQLQRRLQESHVPPGVTVH